MNILMALAAFQELLPRGPEINYDAIGLPILLGGFVAVVVAGAIVVMLAIFAVRAILKRKNGKNGPVPAERE